MQEGNVRLKTADNYIEPDVVSAIKGTIIPEDTVVFAKIGEDLRKSTLEAVRIIVPDMASQERFSDLAIQSDKSKLLLQNRYEIMNQVDRRLLTCLMKTTQLSR